MTPNRPGLRAGAALLTMVAASVAAAYVAMAAAPPRPVQPVLTPEAYRVALAPVQSCADFFRRPGTLPDATPLLPALFTDGIPEQAVGESQDAFVGRIIQRLFARLGDPSRIVTIVPTDAEARYDAAAQTMTIALAQPFAAVLDDGQAGRTRLHARFGFPAGALPRTVEFPMSPAEASRFRAGAGALRILSLFQDYGVEDRPAARIVRLTPKCAVFTNGGLPLPGWRFDGWSAAPQAQ